MTPNVMTTQMKAQCPFSTISCKTVVGLSDSWNLVCECRCEQSAARVFPTRNETTTTMLSTLKRNLSIHPRAYMNHNTRDRRGALSRERGTPDLGTSTRARLTPRWHSALRQAFPSPRWCREARDANRQRQAAMIAKLPRLRCHSDKLGCKRLACRHGRGLLGACQRRRRLHRRQLLSSATTL